MTTENVTKNPLKCTVLSVSKDQKTVKVKIPQIVPASMYGKRLHRYTVLFADSSQHPSLTPGSMVEITPCRRISKLKTWEVKSVVKNLN